MVGYTHYFAAGVGSQAIFDVPRAMYMFDKVFANFSRLTRKNLHKENACHTYNLEVDTYCDLWKKETHTLIDTLEIKMTHIARQFKYYKLQLMYPENITHNSRRTSYTHLHT